MKGTIESLNSHLIHSIFKGKKNYSGSACVLDVKVCDHESCSSRQIQVTTNSIEDPILLYMPVDSHLSRPIIHVDEEANVLIGSNWVNAENLMLKNVKEHEHGEGSKTDELDLRHLMLGKAFSLLNGNNMTNEGITACLEISVNKGEISLQEYQDDGTLTFFDHGQSNDLFKRSKTIKMRGSIQTINNRIAPNLMYHSIQGEIGHGQVNVTVSREITCEEQQQQNCICNFETYDAKGSLDIFIVPINSHPVIEWHGKDVVDTRVGESVSLRGLKIVDDDVKDTKVIDSQERISEGFLTVTISVTKGQLTFQKMIGITTIIGDGLNDEMIKIMGNLDNINNALQSLEFQCENNNSSNLTSQNYDKCKSGMPVQLKVHVNDNSFSGEGDALENEIEVEIMIL